MKPEYESIGAQLRQCIEYLAQEGHLKPGATVVLGCSTSEVAGGLIGKNSVPELGDAIAETMINTCKALGLRPVFQCCEHLNRALVMEQETLDHLRLRQVNVMPVPKAGGSAGAAAWLRFQQPAVADFIQADAAIDIGDTLVGMHLRPVAVPLRMGEGETKVGQAHVVMAYSRLPFIGGSRAQYPEVV
ncbi:MAG: TIGR01440 family protein, partial [Clostridia bacterium]|nr:TIGR01440 family protein [Clostridia bacterium]